MNKFAQIILFFTLFLCTPVSFYAQLPYQYSWEIDGYIGGVETIIVLTALAVDRSVQPLTLQEVNQLARGSINQFDRSAAYNYSKSASHTSDVNRSVDQERLADNHFNVFRDFRIVPLS
jgi:hypothetical protein